MAPTPGYEKTPPAARAVPDGISAKESGEGQYHAVSIRQMGWTPDVGQPNGRLPLTPKTNKANMNVLA
jgi:hypothetical protein